MNETELKYIVGLLGVECASLQSQISAIRAKYNYKNVIVTLGSDGVVAYDGDTFYKQDVFPVEVKDTVGAGDAFLAGYTSCILDGKTEKEALRYGAAIGALTASKHGGTPEISQEEIDSFLS